MPFSLPPLQAPPVIIACQYDGRDRRAWQKARARTHCSELRRNEGWAFAIAAFLLVVPQLLFATAGGWALSRCKNRVNVQTASEMAGRQ